MTNRTYDTLKLVALLLAPVLAFAASIVNIWGIPHGQEIVATLTALDTLIGAVVVAAKHFYDNTEEEEDPIEKSLEETEE